MTEAMSMMFLMNNMSKTPSMGYPPYDPYMGMNSMMPPGMVMPGMMPPDPFMMMYPPIERKKKNKKKKKGAVDVRININEKLNIYLLSILYLYIFTDFVIIVYLINFSLQINLFFFQFFLIFF